MDIIVTIIALLSTIPFIVFIILFIVLKKMTNQATRSTKMAADLSCFLFVIAFIGLVDYLFNAFLLWELMLFYIVFLALIITYQWRKGEEIYLMRAVRFVWRASFVMLSVAYFLLVPIAIFLQLY
ncbi:DUF3397 domain-containing protein [Alkalibacillus haloalkaliphilus]|uniref:DUF3397 domain-containing protein n=1 Tax=Alkalibacillus haloalkaliphilus TaxID=94136 RepID=UPI0003015747|nr:DUF3397 domain-containing protein [Alkalibacillus haloalkaliphilus]